MKVLDFIKEHIDWEYRLGSLPYRIKASWDGDYVILKYNQYESDFHEEIVRECRGSIFYIPNHDHKQAICVCMPFYKFGNYGESYADTIDWTHAWATEKIDGSLIKVWYHNGWHVSTNGCIDAAKAPTQVEGLSFYDIFMRILNKIDSAKDFFNALKTNYVYMFELVSPDARVTIEYPEDRLYILCGRNMDTFQEETYPSMHYNYVKVPVWHYVNSLEQCIEEASKMGADEEGFVVCDPIHHRVKVKSDAYLVASRARHNNVVNAKYVIELMREEKLDDFLAYAPDKKEIVDNILSIYQWIEDTLDLYYLFALQMKADKTDMQWYQVVEELPAQYRGYAYSRMNGKVSSTKEYLENMTISKLVDWIDEERVAE